MAFSLGAQEAVKRPNLEIEELNVAKYLTLSPKARSNLYVVFREAKREIPFCMYGKVNGRMVYVDNVEIPLVQENSKLGAKFNVTDYCNMKIYIGMAHNHKGDCSQSPTDRKTFLLDRRMHVELIVCGTGKENNHHMNMAAYFIDRNKR